MLFVLENGRIMFWGGCIYPIKGCVHHRVSIINMLSKMEYFFCESKLAGGLLCMMQS